MTTVAERTIQLDDWGAEFVASCRDLDQTVVDLSDGLSEQFYVFQNPDGTSFTVPVDVLDEDAGTLNWVSTEGFFNKPGIWLWQVKLVFGTQGMFRSNVVRVRVKENL